MLLSTLIYLAVSMFLLWFLIEHFGGSRPDNTFEVFIVCAVMSFVGALNNLLLIFSLQPMAIYTGIFIGIVISNFILYLYLEFRYGISEKRKIIYIIMAFFIGRFIVARILGLPIY